MNIRLDRNNPVPIGIQVKEQLKMLIDSGTYKDNDKLPSINQLAAFLEVNKNTIVSVLKDLESEGYVVRHRGRGVFVKRNRNMKHIDDEFVHKIDSVIFEAKRKNISASRLINLINARFLCQQEDKKARALFIMGIGREIVDINLQKLRENIPGAEFDGLFLSGSLTRDDARKAFEWADVLIVPSIMYEHVKNKLPKNKPVIKTMANLKLLEDLRAGTDKKSKIAIIGATQRGAEILADMFISAKLFKPKLTLAHDDIEKHKKQLKDIDSVVACISSKKVRENPRLKDKKIYYFSDYLDDGSMDEIRCFVRELQK